MKKDAAENIRERNGSSVIAWFSSPAIRDAIPEHLGLRKQDGSEGKAGEL